MVSDAFLFFFLELPELQISLRDSLIYSFKYLLSSYEMTGINENYTDKISCPPVAYILVREDKTT